MSALASPKIAQSLARCSICGHIKIIQAVDRACQLAVCKQCVPFLVAAAHLIDLANRNHGARLSHPVINPN